MLVAVGDLKQSIYRFRGADVSVFARLIRAFEAGEGRALHLSENHRSAPAVLDLVNEVSDRALQPPLGEAPRDDEIAFAPGDRLVPRRAEGARPACELLVDGGRGERRPSAGCARPGARGADPPGSSRGRPGSRCGSAGRRAGRSGRAPRGSATWRSSSSASPSSAPTSGRCARPASRSGWRAAAASTRPRRSATPGELLASLADPEDAVAWAALLRSPACAVSDGSPARSWPRVGLSRLHRLSPGALDAELAGAERRDGRRGADPLVARQVGAVPREPLALSSSKGERAGAPDERARLARPGRLPRPAGAAGTGWPCPSCSPARSRRSTSTPPSWPARGRAAGRQPGEGAGAGRPIRRGRRRHAGRAGRPPARHGGPAAARAGGRAGGRPTRWRSSPSTRPRGWSGRWSSCRTWAAAAPARPGQLLVDGAGRLCTALLDPAREELVDDRLAGARHARPRSGPARPSRGGCSTWPSPAHATTWCSPARPATARAGGRVEAALAEAPALARRDPAGGGAGGAGADGGARRPRSPPAAAPAAPPRPRAAPGGAAGGDRAGGATPAARAATCWGGCSASPSRGARPPARRRSRPAPPPAARWPTPCSPRPTWPPRRWSGARSSPRSRPGAATTRRAPG